jgi:dTMP kinase
VAESPPGQHDLRGVLRIAPFRRLWIALTFSSLGDWLGLLATTSLAQELVQGYSSKVYAIGGVLFVRLLPALVIGPFAGAWADRFNRRTTMVVADSIRCALLVSIPLVRTLPWLLAASLLIECVGLFWIPAKEASVPNLVPRERLESANQISLVTTYGSAAIASVIFTLLSLLTSALAAGLSFFKTNTVDLALYFDAATFLFSALTIFRLRQISSPADGVPRGEQPTVIRAILDGWAFVGQQRWLRGLVIGILGAVAAGGAVIALSRPFVNILRAGNAGYGVLFGTVFVGLATGMFLGPRLLEGVSRRRLMGLSIVAAGVWLSFVALMPNLLLAIVCTFFVGAFAGITWVVGITLVGLEVDDDKRGRTFAFLYTLMRIVMLVVLAAAPFISGAIGPHEIYVQHVRIRLDGVTLTLFGAGVLAVVIGVVCYRLMDDRRDISLWADFLAAVRRTEPFPGRGTERGLFVAFEGGEGAGKSTQVNLLADWLREQGHEVVVTREPGATAVGRRLRAMLLDSDTRGLSSRAEALLYAADRAQHVDEVIRPALERGAVVLTDRYVDSSLAYQGAGRTLPRHEVRRMSQWATGGLVPDITVVLDIDPVLGLARSVGPADRLESEALGFHRRVRAGFLDLAGDSPHRYLVVDATLPPESVAQAVRERVRHHLSKPAAPDTLTLAPAEVVER